MNVETWIVPVVFWIAIVAIVALQVRGRSAAERERQQTLRVLIERGQPLDGELIKQLAAPPVRRSPVAVSTGLAIGGTIVAFFGVGLAVLGLFLGMDEPDALRPVVGSGSLFLATGTGLLVAGRLQRRLQGQAAAMQEAPQARAGVPAGGDARD